MVMFHHHHSNILTLTFSPFKHSVAHYTGKEGRLPAAALIQHTIKVDLHIQRTFFLWRILQTYINTKSPVNISARTPTDSHCLY